MNLVKGAQEIPMTSESMVGPDNTPMAIKHNYPAEGTPSPKKVDFSQNKAHFQDAIFTERKPLKKSPNQIEPGSNDHSKSKLSGYSGHNSNQTLLRNETQNSLHIG